MRYSFLLIFLLASLGCSATDGRKQKNVLSEAEETTIVEIAKEPDPANATFENIHVASNLTATKLYLSEADISDSIKGRSVFSTRMYAEDLAASGSVSAATLLVKRSAHVKGEVTVLGSVTATTLDASSVVTSSNVESTTATITGSLSAGKIETKGIDDIGNEIVALRLRVQQLEDFVKRLASNCDGGHGGGSGRGMSTTLE